LNPQHPENLTMIEYTKLQNVPRLLIEADLKPLQGERFQPTGFADLGPARYALPDGTEMLLVESAQSVANRMEVACWDDAATDVITELRGLPYITVKTPDNKWLTSSVLEAHRINSEYIMKDGGQPSEFYKTFANELEYRADSPVQWRKFYEALLKYDVNSLIHGCFLEEIGGRLRVARALSGFVEARDVRVAESGGVKNNIVQPELKGGEGNVPFHRTEFVAREIKAFFNLDLAQLRSFGFKIEIVRFLAALSLFKVRRFLSTGLRLRTACDLELLGDLRITAPDNGFGIPDEEALLDECAGLIKECARDGTFATPPVTQVTRKLEPPKSPKKSQKEVADNESEEGSPL
jgi:CRISPR-associated protein Csb1